MKYFKNIILGILIIVFLTTSLSSCMAIGSIIRYHLNQKNNDRPPPYSEEGLGTLGEEKEDE